MEYKHYNQFGIWVAQQLIILGWSKGDLARKIGVKQPYLSNVLSGKQLGARYIDPIITLITDARAEQEKKGESLREVI